VSPAPVARQRVAQAPQTVSTIAAANGTATITFQAPNVRAGLTIDTIDFRVIGTVGIPVCVLTINGQQRAVKRAADRGQIMGEGDVLYLGQLLVLSFSNCDTGAIVEATLRGTG